VSAALLDVNVLIALFDPAHPNHENAHEWFGPTRRRGWASCPLTINGCVRVLSNPAYPTVEATASEVISRLRALCKDDAHQFWPDGASLLDDAIFRAEFIAGHQKITDAYLLAIAVRHSGRLATFDRSIPIKAVKGARSEHVELLGGPG
jgi:hypothetical protein